MDYDGNNFGFRHYLSQSLQEREAKIMINSIDTNTKNSSGGWTVKDGDLCEQRIAKYFVTNENENVPPRQLNNEMPLKQFKSRSDEQIYCNNNNPKIISQMTHNSGDVDDYNNIMGEANFDSSYTENNSELSTDYKCIDNYSDKINEIQVNNFLRVPEII